MIIITKEVDYVLYDALFSLLGKTRIVHETYRWFLQYGVGTHTFVAAEL
jgi:hypothetical protein